jgi:uncharacterized membrane protein YdjX (TVP38/TMEM64 family)
MRCVAVKGQKPGAAEGRSDMTPVERQSLGDVDARNVTLARLRRFVPLAVVALITITVFATGTHRHLSLETLVRHRMAIDAFIAAHSVAAVGAFMLIYITVVALSIPGSVLLTISGGIVFGTLLGGLAALVSATVGATIIFLIASSACGGSLVRRAGPLAAKIADGICADAFSYLLFLRLVPAFPFFLVNLAAAVVGVKLRTFIIATAIGIVPATFVYAFLGDGLDSVLAAKDAAYQSCLASGAVDCRLHFDLAMLATPRLLAALAALGAIALVPVVVRRLWARAVDRSAPVS